MLNRCLWLVSWLCFTSHRQRGRSERAPPFTVTCKGREARFLHRSHRDRTPMQNFKQYIRGHPIMIRTKAMYTFMLLVS